MKTLLLTCLFLHSALQATTVIIEPPIGHNGDKELSWVDEQIQAILPARIGVADGYISALKDPMKTKKNSVVLSPAAPKLYAPPALRPVIQQTPTPAPVVVEEPLRLYALMNRSALINGKWYHVGESIRTFSISEIKNNSVLLTGKKGQLLLLFLNKQNNNIKITTK